MSINISKVSTCIDVEETPYHVTFSTNNYEDFRFVEAVAKLVEDYRKPENERIAEWVRLEEQYEACSIPIGNMIYYKCSHCGYEHRSPTLYCPFCGFTMRNNERNIKVNES